VEHIAEPAWADFVRGHSTPKAKSAIESHLSGGCAACSSAAALWKSFMNVAAQEKLYTPPPHTVRLAKAQFAAAKLTASAARTLRLAPQSVPVALLNRQGEPLQRTSTSNFGEFHLEVAVEAEMQLAIELASGRTVCITLPTGSCDRADDFGEQNRLPGREGKDYTGK
jgi:hypothetical protein